MKEDFLVQMYRELEQLERQQREHNMALLKENNIPLEDYNDLVYGCSVTGKMEVVDKPEGRSNDEEIGVFKEVYVRQWTSNEAGDAFHGFIFGKFGENKWLKVPYEC